MARPRARRPVEYSPTGLTTGAQEPTSPYELPMPVSVPRRRFAHHSPNGRVRPSDILGATRRFLSFAFHHVFRTATEGLLRG